jgi:hypothetical protein
MLTAAQARGVADAVGARFSVTDGAEPATSDSSMARLLAPLVQHWRRARDDDDARAFEITPDRVQFSIATQPRSQTVTVCAVAHVGALVFAPALNALIYVAREQRVERVMTRADYRGRAYSYTFSNEGELQLVQE